MARRFQKPSGASAHTTGLHPYLEGGGERSLVQPSSATHMPPKFHSDLAWCIFSSAQPSRNREHDTELSAPSLFRQRILSFVLRKIYRHKQKSDGSILLRSYIGSVRRKGKKK